MSKGPTKKLQVEFGPQDMQRFEAVEAQEVTITKAETIRRALRFLEWIASLEPANDLVVLDDQGQEVFKIPVSTLQ